MANASQPHGLPSPLFVDPLSWVHFFGGDKGVVDAEDGIADGSQLTIHWKEHLHWYEEA